MATWVRSFTANLVGTADTTLSGPADLDTDTVPGDFQAANVTSVRFQFTLSHQGTFNTGTGSDTFTLTGNPVELEDTTDNTQLATVSPTGVMQDGTDTVAIDLTDSSPTTTASNTDWAGAQFNGTAGTIATFAQNKSADGVTPQILAASVTITITYSTPTQVTGAVEAVAETLGTPLQVHEATGSLEVVAESSGTLNQTHELTGSITAVAETAGVLTVQSLIDVTGNITSVAELAGALTQTHMSSADVTVLVEARASPTQTHNPTGTLSAVVEVSGVLTVVGTNELTGTITAVAETLGTPRQVHTPTATVTAVVEVAGTPSVVAGTELTGTITSVVEAAGVVVQTHMLTAATTTVATVAATPTQTHLLVGAAAAVGEVAGTPTVTAAKVTPTPGLNGVTDAYAGSTALVDF